MHPTVSRRLSLLRKTPHRTNNHAMPISVMTVDTAAAAVIASEGTSMPAAGRVKRAISAAMGQSGKYAACTRSG